MTDREEQLKKDVSAQIDRMRNLPPDKMEQKLTDMKAMISHYVTMTDEIEARRERHYEFTLLYAAILVPALALVLAKHDSLNDLVLWLAAGWLSVQLVFAIISIGVFYFQSHFSYPFLELEGYSNQWKWFYYGNPAVRKMSTDAVFRPLVGRKDKTRTTIPYLQGLQDFARYYHDETLETETVATLIQLYLFQVHNYYKNRWHKQLYSLSTIAVLVGAAWLVAVLIVNWLR